MAATDHDLCTIDVCDADAGHCIHTPIVCDGGVIFEIVSPLVRVDIFDD